MGSRFLCVAVQQPAQVLLEVRVIDARVVQPQGLTTQTVGGIDEETHGPFQNGNTVQPTHPLDDHVLLHAPQTIEHKAIYLQDINTIYFIFMHPRHQFQLTTHVWT